MEEKLSFLKINKKLNIALKVIAIIGVLIVPVMNILIMEGLDVKMGHRIMIYDYLWVALYSSVLACMVCEKKWFKRLACGMNIVVVGIWVYVSLMGGIEAIPGVLWCTMLPFLSNPWF